MVGNSAYNQVCLKTADHHRPPQNWKETCRPLLTTSDHPRTARKTAGHTAEQGGTGKKNAEQQRRHKCIFRVNVSQISIARSLRHNYIQTYILIYINSNSFTGQPKAEISLLAETESRPKVT